MKRKLYHPLWVHLPAVGAIVWVIVEWVKRLPLPASAAIHFNAAGRADNWGSPNPAMLIVVGVMVVYLGMGVLVDELWARSEKAKRFNWMTWFDDALVGWMAFMGMAFVQAAKAGSGDLGLDWTASAGVAAACAAAALFLESRRPFVPQPPAVQDEAAVEATAQLIDRMKGTSDWTYWESQNPWWISVVAIGVAVFVLVDAGVMYAATHSTLGVAGMTLIALLCVGLYGGFRITVTREALTVRLGIFGIRLLRLPLTEIGSVETREFFPLKDFGGYGIRFNREMKAYFLRGNVGVLITDIRGKKTLIGSDNPERLVAVIEAAKQTP